jgi:hypothetical protein
MKCQVEGKIDISAKENERLSYTIELEDKLIDSVMNK